MSSSPLVFISHSSFDKDRFVRRFVFRLGDKGVKTIYDERDFTLNRTLPDAIFEEGIASASVIVIVLSHAALKSPFVKAEREASVMRRIEEGTPILLLVLDELSSLDIPMSLRRHVRVSVEPSNEESFENAVAKVVQGAYGQHPTQEIGPPPPWTLQPQGTEDPLDMAMLGIATSALLEDDARCYVERELYFAEAKRLGRCVDDAEESLLELARRQLLKGYNSVGQGRTALRYCVTPIGASIWMQATDSQYEEKVRQIAATIFNENCTINWDLARVTNFPLPFVNHALDLLEIRGHVHIPRVAAAGRRRIEPQSSLRRYLSRPAS